MVAGQLGALIIMRLFVTLPAAVMLAGSVSVAFADVNQMHKAANGAHAEILLGLACKNSGYRAEIYDRSLKRAELLLEQGGYSAASAKVLVDTYRKQDEADHSNGSTMASSQCDRIWQSLNKPANDKAWMGTLPVCKVTTSQRPAWCPANH